MAGGRCPRAGDARALAVLHVARPLAPRLPPDRPPPLVPVSARATWAPATRALSAGRTCGAAVAASSGTWLSSAPTHGTPPPSCAPAAKRLHVSSMHSSGSSAPSVAGPLLAASYGLPPAAPRRHLSRARPPPSPPPPALRVPPPGLSPCLATQRSARRGPSATCRAFLALRRLSAPSISPSSPWLLGIGSASPPLILPMSSLLASILSRTRSPSIVAEMASTSCGSWMLQLMRAWPWPPSAPLGSARSSILGAASPAPSPSSVHLR